MKETKLVSSILHAIRNNDYLSTYSDVVIDCPFCFGNKKMYISVGIGQKRGVYHCFRCGEKGLLRKYVPLPSFQFDEVERKTFSVGKAWFLANGKNPDYSVEVEQAKAFLESRGLDEERYIKANPFVVKGSDMLYFGYNNPIEDNGSFARNGLFEYILGRDIKKKFYKDFGSKPIFFLNPPDKDVVLVEGLFDALTLDGSAAILGKYITPNQVLQLKKMGVERVTIIVDPTEEKIFKSCVGVHLIVHGLPTKVIHYHGTDSDPNELGEDACFQMMDVIEPIEYNTLVSLELIGDEEFAVVDVEPL